MHKSNRFVFLLALFNNSKMAIKTPLQLDPNLAIHYHLCAAHHKTHPQYPHNTSWVLTCVLLSAKYWHYVFFITWRWLIWSISLVSNHYYCSLCDDNWFSPSVLQVQGVGLGRKPLKQWDDMERSEYERTIKYLASVYSLSIILYPTQQTWRSLSVSPPSWLQLLPLDLS